MSAFEATSNPSEVFKFLNLRAAQKITKGQLASQFINIDSWYYSISSTTLSAIENPDPLLFTRLVSDLSSQNPRTALETRVSGFRTAGLHYWSTKQLVDDEFEFFEDILDYLISVDFMDTVSNFSTFVENLRGVSINEYLNPGDNSFLERKLRLLDNYYAEIILPKKSELRDYFGNILRILNLFEAIDNSNTQLNTLIGFRNLFLGSIILPKPVFPLPAITNPGVQTPDPYNNGSAAIEAAWNQLNSLNSAFDEFVTSINSQNISTGFSIVSQSETMIEQVNSGSLSNPSSRQVFEGAKPQNASYLSETNFNALSNDTLDTLETVGISTFQSPIEYTASRVNKSIREQYDVIFKDARGFDSVVAVGGSMVAISKFCFKELELLEQSDPCSVVYGTVLPKGSGNIQPVGIADLLVIKQQLLKYELGEIAHVENIIKSEKKEREHRKLNRIEESIISESERSSESMNDTQTTERFSVETELSKIAEQSSQNNSSNDNGWGITASATYGPASITGFYNSSTSNSLSSATANIEAQRSATSYAKEVTSRAVKKVSEKVRELRSKTIIEEVIETNKHSFDNTSGTGHVVGMYHWLDKYYLTKTINYGKRLMFEFMIPEPAVFHIFTRKHAREQSINIKMPVPLEVNHIHNFESINESNYARYASLYGASNITPPPPLFKWVNKAFSRDFKPDTTAVDYPRTEAHNDIEIPEGYEAFSFFPIIIKSWNNNPPGMLNMIVGTDRFNDTWMWEVPLTKRETGILPVTIFVDYYNAFVANLEVKCIRSQATYDKWRINTYNAILEAYNRAMSEYEDAIAIARVEAGVGVLGNNPERNREIEKEELKKASISLLTAQKYESFGAIKIQDTPPYEGFPEVDDLQALGEGNYVKFFEQAFEWQNMMYLFYPYFWGRKNNWKVVKTFEDSDPLFTKFLQAGFARVVVPVRPNFTEPILHFIKTGEVWSGGSPPSINDELYLSIVQEIKDSQSQTNSDGVQIGDPWIVKVPTNLVALQSNIPPDLPDFSADLL